MMKTLRSLALAGIVALAAFCAKDKSAWQGTIEEVEGVTIVRNPAKPVLDGGLFTLEEELSIGDEDGSRTIAFSDMSHLTADDQGWIYALDRKESCVQVFAADGRHLRTIGQPGQGPGDLNEPILVYFLRGEVLATQDKR